MPEDKQIPMVSVYMITYNHEPYIAQALESVLEQQTDFDFEIVIGDDCSTDGTTGIIAEYQKKHPQKIHLLTSDTNLGAKENSVRTLKACRGKYIATLEGDDYWTDPMKLQKQIDFLERNPEFSACFGGYFVVDAFNNGEKINNIHPRQRSDKVLKNILGGYTIHPRTLIFRNHESLVRSFVNDFAECYNGDTAISFLIATYGRIKYMDQLFAAYRMHQGGVYSTKSVEYHYNNLINTYTTIFKHLHSKSDKKVLSRTIANFHRRLAIISFKEKQYIKSIRNLKNTFKYNMITFFKTLRELI
ncbi:MAG: hypothetical protein DRI87_01970 [Bacteroidetes bacterium]|nr:MAG: hypothetical protein DRI87_01970 [Bacteroidota bacterium]